MLLFIYMDYIKSFVREIVKEAFAGEHSLERLSERFLDRNEIEVGFEKEGTVGEYQTIGTYSLNNEEKDAIKTKYKLIENQKFPDNEDFGIKIAYIKIEPSRINYYSEEDKKESIGKVLVFVDKETNSNGNEIYVIVRNNEIQTVYFGKSYIKQTKEKLRVDRIIKLTGDEDNILDRNKKKKEGGSRKKIELDFPKVNIDGKVWYIDEANEQLIYSKNINKKVSFDRLTDKQFEQLIELI